MTLLDNLQREAQGICGGDRLGRGLSPCPFLTLSSLLTDICSREFKCFLDARKRKP